MHPAGSISLAAQERFRRAEGGGDSNDPERGTPGRGMPGMSDAIPTDVVSFPFVFPTPGAYRIFVQVKIDGTVETAVYDVEVPEG